MQSSRKRFGLEHREGDLYWSLSESEGRKEKKKKRKRKKTKKTISNYVL